MLFAEQFLDHRGPIPAKLRVAVIGTGFADRVQIPGFRLHPLTEVVAVCSQREERAKAIAEKYAIVGVYTDYEKMITREKPDIVSIVTPPHLHLPMTLFAFANGAHVLCEKPLAMNTAETRQMLAAAEAAGRVHVVNHEFRYIPARMYQKVLFEKGFVGEPLFFECTHLQDSRMSPTVKWTWWSDANQGGGMWGAIGSHYIDSFHWWTGATTKEISCTLHIPYATRPTTEGEPRPVTADEGVNAILELTNGIKCIMNLHSAAAGDIRRLTIHGSEGALIVRDDRFLFGRAKGERELKPITVPNEFEPPTWQPVTNLLLGPFVRLVDLLVGKILKHSLAGPAWEPANFADGISVQQVLDAGRQSNIEGRRLLIADVDKTIETPSVSPTTTPASPVTDGKPADTMTVVTLQADEALDKTGEDVSSATIKTQHESPPPSTQPANPKQEPTTNE
jgi:predicted dehydrogenase